MTRNIPCPATKDRGLDCLVQAVDAWFNREGIYLGGRVWCGGVCHVARERSKNGASVMVTNHLHLFYDEGTTFAIIFGGGKRFLQRLVEFLVRLNQHKNVVFKRYLALLQLI